MKWKTDWLYALIYRDIEEIWKRAAQDGKGARGPSPDYFVISQFANVKVQPYNESDRPLLAAYVVDPVIGQWVFDEAGMRRKVEADTNARSNNARRGMFYTVGTVAFGISADRKLVVITYVVITYVVGPLYAKHRVFGVTVQGKSGRMQPKEGFEYWMS